MQLPKTPTPVPRLLVSKPTSLPLLLELGIVSRTAVDECFPIHLLQDDFGVQVPVSINKRDNENNIIGFQ